MSTEVKTLGDMAADSTARDKQPGRPGEPVSADRQIAAYFERLEKERLARRAEIRRQIAERDKLMVRVTDLEAELRALDARCDDLAAEHARKCEPLQTKLQAASAAARTKLLAEVTVFNCELEESLQAVRRVRSKVVREHRDVRSAAAGLPTEASLSGADLASPKLLAEKHAGECRRRAAQLRVDRAHEMLRRFVPELEMMRSASVPEHSHGWSKVDSRRGLDYETIHKLQLRVDRWQCELVHASQETHAAEQALAEIAAAMRAE